MDYRSHDQTKDEIHQVDAAIQSFIDAQTRPAPAASVIRPRLFEPIIIPQRRPGNKQRGFVEANSPILDQYGVTQEIFVNLIRAINEATKASKWLYAVQIAAAGTSFVPNSIAMGTAAGVQLIAGIVAKAEQRWKTNSFLDRVNQDFFRPRGLWCLLMCYDPLGKTEQKLAEEDIAVLAHSFFLPEHSNIIGEARRKLRDPIDATTKGTESLPVQVAPLIYQERNQLPAGGQPTAANKVTARFDKLNVYLDRRAQAKYTNESDGDVLSMPIGKPFRNRYLDPNHPASSSGILGLISGGRLAQNPEKFKQQMQSAMASQEVAVREQQSLMRSQLQQQLKYVSPEHREAYAGQYENMFNLQLEQIEKSANLLEQSHRHIVRNILYLMIVEVPTEVALSAARARMDSSGLYALGSEAAVVAV